MGQACDDPAGYVHRSCSGEAFARMMAGLMAGLVLVELMQYSLLKKMGDLLVFVMMMVNLLAVVMV